MEISSNMDASITLDTTYSAGNADTFKLNKKRTYSTVASIGGVDDTVALSNKARELSQKQNEENSTLIQEQNADNGAVGTNGVQGEESTEESSESNLEKLQKTLQHAKDKLKKVQEKIAEAQAETQNADSEEKKQMAVIKVTSLMAELASAQAEVIEISDQIQEELKRSGLTDPVSQV